MTVILTEHSDPEFFEIPIKLHGLLSLNLFFNTKTRKLFCWDSASLLCSIEKNVLHYFQWLALTNDSFCSSEALKGFFEHVVYLVQTIKPRKLEWSFCEDKLVVLNPAIF